MVGFENGATQLGVRPNIEIIGKMRELRGKLEGMSIELCGFIARLDGDPPHPPGVGGLGVAPTPPQSLEQIILDCDRLLEEINAQHGRISSRF